METGEEAWLELRQGYAFSLAKLNLFFINIWGYCAKDSARLMRAISRLHCSSVDFS